MRRVGHKREEKDRYVRKREGKRTREKKRAELEIKDAEKEKE